MKRIAAAAIFSLLSSAAFAAEPLICAMTDVKGNEITYTFELDEVGELEEHVFTRNGNVVHHEPSERPVWTMHDVDGGMVIKYLRDPRFFIGVKTGVKRVGAFLTSDAILVKNEAVIARGKCGYKKI